eukprot:m.259045 g.259045  ORF g.259045 m.259045 type:complete len:228 (+) comp37464_c0_seq1:93-776(+)
MSRANADSVEAQLPTEVMEDRKIKRRRMELEKFKVHKVNAEIAKQNRIDYKGKLEELCKENKWKALSIKTTNIGGYHKSFTSVVVINSKKYEGIRKFHEDEAEIDALRLAAIALIGLESLTAKEEEKHEEQEEQPKQEPKLALKFRNDGSFMERFLKKQAKLKAAAATKENQQDTDATNDKGNGKGNASESSSGSDSDSDSSDSDDADVGPMPPAATESDDIGPPMP